MSRQHHRLSTFILRVLDVQVPLLMKPFTAEQKEHVKSLLRPGDILLKDDNSHPLGQMTNRFARSRWSHSAFYPGGDCIVDVGTKPYVAKIELDTFLECTDLGIFRPKYASEEDRQSALSYVESCMGRPLNRTFSLEKKDAYYCAQLIYCALKQTPNPIELPLVSVLGRPYVTSASIERSPNVEKVWIRRTGLLRRLAGHLPTLLPMGVTAGLAAPHGVGPVLGGAFTALVVTAFIGNKLVRKR